MALKGKSAFLLLRRFRALNVFSREFSSEAPPYVPPGPMEQVAIVRKYGQASPFCFLHHEAYVDCLLVPHALWYLPCRQYGSLAVCFRYRFVLGETIIIPCLGMHIQMLCYPPKESRPPFWVQA